MPGWVIGHGCANDGRTCAHPLPRTPPHPLHRDRAGPGPRVEAHATVLRCRRPGTPSSGGPTTRPPVGSTRWSRSWWRAGSAQNSLFPGPDRWLQDHQPIGAVAIERPRSGGRDARRARTAHHATRDAPQAHRRRGRGRGTTSRTSSGSPKSAPRSSWARSATSPGSRPRTRFAAYNGTAPIEWSSGNPKHPIRRLSRRGNRTLNHVIHIAAVTQLRHPHSPGRGFYDRKRAEGMTSRSARPSD